MSATKEDRKPKGVPVPEPEPTAEPGPIAEPGAESPPAHPARDLATLEADMLAARSDSVTTERNFARELAAKGFTARKKKVANVNGRLYQASGDKVIELSGGAAFVSPPG